MNLASVGVLAAQGVLAVVALVAGGTTVAGHEMQVEEFQRFGYPAWGRIATGVIDLSAAGALLAGFRWTRWLLPVGSILVGAVTARAVLTHHRVDDPLSKIAVPAQLCGLAVLVTAAHLQLAGV